MTRGSLAGSVHGGDRSVPTALPPLHSSRTIHRVRLRQTLHWALRLLKLKIDSSKKGNRTNHLLLRYKFYTRYLHIKIVSV